jgi:hypothetical protein
MVAERKPVAQPPLAGRTYKTQPAAAGLQRRIASFCVFLRVYSPRFLRSTEPRPKRPCWGSLSLCGLQHRTDYVRRDGHVYTMPIRRWLQCGELSARRACPVRLSLRAGFERSRMGPEPKIRNSAKCGGHDACLGLELSMVSLEFPASFFRSESPTTLRPSLFCPCLVVSSGARSTDKMRQLPDFFIAFFRSFCR